MTRQLALDNTTLNALQKDNTDLDAACSLNAEYFVPVTQRHEFVYSFDTLGFDKQRNICEVLTRLNPTPLEIVCAPFGIAPFGAGSFGGEDCPHYNEILTEMGGDDQHAWDALGAEAAIENDMEFVSEDGGVIDALESYSPENLLRYDEFVALINNQQK